MNPDQSFGGKIVHKASDDEGIIKFRAHNATCYAYFLVYNVYITQSVQAKNWADIGLKKGANFQIAFCVSSSLHIAGLVWLQRKPLNCPVIQFNQNRAILVLSSYFSSIQITIPTPPVSSTNKAQKNASQNKSQTIRVTPADALSGFTARIWKVINDDEGLLYLMHKSYRTIIWFNKSNLQRIQKKFVSIRELLDLVFHVDAKLIYSPKNPGQNDYVWYHALAFWDEKTSRPETFGHVIGDNLDSYEPTSLYSAKLKQAFEFKQNGINSAVVEKLFKELSIFDFNVINSSVPKVPDVNREGVKNDNQILLPNVSIVDTSYNINFPPLTQITACNSSKVKTSVPSQILDESPIKQMISNESTCSFIDNNCFKTASGHFLNLKKLVLLRDGFFHALQYKTIFSCSKKENETSYCLPAAFDDYLMIHKSVDNNYTERVKRSNYLQSSSVSTLFPHCLEVQSTNTKYIQFKKGLIVHTSNSLRYGCLLTKYGLVTFSYNNFFVPDDAATAAEDTEVFFDAIRDEVEDCKYTATCVWTTRRPDILTLVKATKLEWKSLKRNNYYRGVVVRLDLPSNAIILLPEADSVAVATRRIFDSKSGNIADYLSLGQHVDVLMENDDSFYVKNVIRIYTIPESVLNSAFEGYGVITNYSLTSCVFQFRLCDQIMSGLFNKDLARIFDDNEASKYLDIGSFIHFRGYGTTLPVYATKIECVPYLKKNQNKDLVSLTLPLVDSEKSERNFIPGKVYTGVVSELKRPYAFVIKARNENGKEECVFVSSRNFEPVQNEGKLTYNDQIQFFVQVDDKVGFVAARGNDMGGLHPFQWTALNSWKVGAVDANVSGSSSVQSPSTGSVSLQKPKDVEDPYMLLFHAKRPVVTDLEEKFNKVTLKPSEENIQHDNKFNLKQCLRECIKNDVKEPELNRIVDSFHNQVLKHKPKEVIEYVTNMFAEKGITVNESYPLGYDKQVQTMSTGNVIYLNIFPDSI